MEVLFIIIGSVIFLFVIITLIIKWIKKPHPTPSPTPTPFPSPTPSPQMYTYLVATYDPNCEPIGEAYISNTMSLDQYIGLFYFNPNSNRIDEILEPAYGVPADLRSYTYPGSDDCCTVPPY